MSDVPWAQPGKPTRSRFLDAIVGDEIGSPSEAVARLLAGQPGLYFVSQVRSRQLRLAATKAEWHVIEAEARHRIQPRLAEALNLPAQAATSTDTFARALRDLHRPTLLLCSKWEESAIEEPLELFAILTLLNDRSREPGPGFATALVSGRLRDSAPRQDAFLGAGTQLQRWSATD